MTPEYSESLNIVNSESHISKFSDMLFNAPMETNDEVRRQNLLLAIGMAGSAAKLAELAKTSPAYLSQIKNRTPDSKTGTPKTMGDDMARRIEAAIGMPYGWMDTPQRAVEQSAIQPSKPAIPFDENVTSAPLGLRPIPVISSVQAGQLRDMDNPHPPGAGYAVEYTDQDLSRWAFALDVDGLSMAPMFQPGDRIIVDPDLAPNPGDFVVARNGSEQATFKKYRPRGIDARGEMIFELVPLNEDYPTLRSDTEHLVVIGVVTEHRKKLRRV
jgi:SOS-response transcriptional repressor LexA